MNPSNHAVEREDIQAMLRSSFGSLRHVRYFLLAVTQPDAARAWLRELVGSRLVLSAAQVGSGAPRVADAVSVAFSASGLRALGHDLGAGEWPFPTAFAQGMASPQRRDLLRDPNEAWLWRDLADSAFGPCRPPADMLLAVFGDTAVWPLALPHPAGRGWHPVTELMGCPAYLEPVGAASVAYEPFGFRDGLSQPVVPQLRDPDEPVLAPDEHDAPASDHQVAPGEFVLGYRNEYGEAAYAPDVPGWAAFVAARPRAAPRFAFNGSYLAVRQIEQDAEDFVTDHCRSRTEAPSAGERMVGRWRDAAGTPLQHKPWPPANPNAFRFRVEDFDGFQCPRGAHVRRANPRDLLGEDRAAGLMQSRLHRLLRRGRPYSHKSACMLADCGHSRHRQLHADGAPAGAQACGAGLMFVACNADLERQFEFVQQRWLANPEFGNLGDEVDPIVGGRDQGHFTVPGLPRGTAITLQRRYTRTVGGGYFFLPGLAALEFLALP